MPPGVGAPVAVLGQATFLWGGTQTPPEKHTPFISSVYTNPSPHDTLPLTPRPVYLP